MDKRNIGPLLLLIKNPPILIGVLLLGIVMIFLMTLLGIAMLTSTTDNQATSGWVPVACQQGDLDTNSFGGQFSNAGAFTGMEDVFIKVASQNQVDPVLLAAIAFHETGRGTSNAVKNKNNPGGLMNPATNWQSLIQFNTLEEGINAMAKNLYKNYVSVGLLTLDQIGTKYAPIGADNDPTNLNSHWVPNVSNIVSSFGGLTMNCSVMGFESGFASPVLGALNITSYFGTRVHPITGKVHTHAGIDFACSPGDPIMAVLDGKVVESKFHKGWGNYIVLSHGDKFTLYAHMTERFATMGQSITQGTPIGSCGTTGSSTGPHLHLEVRVGQKYGPLIDPLPYFQGPTGG